MKDYSNTVWVVITEFGCLVGVFSSYMKALAAFSVSQGKLSSKGMKCEIYINERELDQMAFKEDTDKIKTWLEDHKKAVAGLTC